jgi:Protein of unknown function (DUF4038)/Putative collagen-binding domain of a collagenase
VRVRGFCDSNTESVHRVRFMPTQLGVHKYALFHRQHDIARSHAGEFTVVASNNSTKRRGPVRIDNDHPHHFVYQGTNEHYFWNGTTTYWLLGVQDDKRIEQAIDRFAKLKVNRIRVAINARTKDGSRWFEPQVQNSKDFQYFVNPWVAKNPTSVNNPQFDTTRFNVALWQKLDRLVKYARDNGVIVSVIFHLDGLDAGVDPFNGGKKKGEGYTDYKAEEEYYRYAVARLSAYRNVMWDVTNEWHLFRNQHWVNHFGELIRKDDPSKLLMSVHGEGKFPFYTSPCVDFAMYQSWDEHGSYGFLRRARELAIKAGRPMPQVNEEYGYEDHYPGPWGGGRKKPARSGDNRRRLAWEMSMAGGYQTTGERADEPGQGGWITGLGNDAMTMLNGYAKMVDFFTAFEWWKCDPVDGVADKPAMVLAEAGKQYAVYLPKGGRVSVKLPDGPWTAKWYNPRNGEWNAAAMANEFTAPDADDWAILIRK